MKKAMTLLLQPILLVPLVVTAVLVATGAPARSGGATVGAAAPPTALVEQGRELYLVGCTSCHGIDGQGLEAPDGDQRGPSIVNAGAASAYYYLTTGRMPLASSEDLPLRKDPAYGRREIEALVAYVGSLGDGPGIPAVDSAAGDLAGGGELYRANCQACHSAAGAGGALSYGRAAPALAKATATQIGAAMRVGPGQMPVFGADALTPDEVNSIARYVRYLEDPDDRGGIALGRLGPIPEGFLIWVFGMGALLVICTLIGKRAKDRAEVGP